MSSPIELSSPALPDTVEVARVADVEAFDAHPASGGVLLARLRRRAVRGGLILLAARLTTQVFLWGVTLIVARLLRPYDYGLMTTGMIFVGLADLLADVGLGKALIQKERLQAADLAEGFTLSLLLSILLYGLLFAVAGPAALFLQSPELADLLCVLALAVLLVPFRSIPLALLDRDLHLGKQSAIHVSCAVLQAGLVLSLAVAGLGYWALAAGVIAARLLESAAVGYAAGWRPRLVKPGQASRGLLAFGVHVSLGTLLWFVYSNCDYAVIGKLAGPVALGYYALAFQLISLPVQKLTANVNQVAYPVFCRLQEDRARLRRWYLRMTVLLGFFGIPALTGMALVADDGFRLVLGEQWLPAVRPFQLLSVAGTLMVFSASLPPLFNALGRPDINLKYTATCTLVLPLGFVLLGQPYGLIGICMAWLVLYPFLVGGLVCCTRRLTGVGLGDLVRAQVPVLAAAGFMVGVVMAGQWCLRGVGPIGVRLGVSIALGAGAYSGFLGLFARKTVLVDLGVFLRELKGSRGEA
jgi:O-antigen/teichoic acid export membrane protein